MYNWRRMTPDMRREALEIRRRYGQPWHSPPHGLESHWYHLSAACYEHCPVIGQTLNRLAGFESALLETLAPVTQLVSAWCVLPNHYHILLQCMDIAICRKALGKLHGRTSHEWNTQDGTRGRKCWHGCLPKPVKSERHRWATLNYIHHNPVHHGYVAKWQDWPFSSAEGYLATAGREFAERVWNEYPLFEYGKGWDPPDA